MSHDSRTRLTHSHKTSIVIAVLLVPISVSAAMLAGFASPAGPDALEPMVSQIAPRHGSGNRSYAGSGLPCTDNLQQACDSAPQATVGSEAPEIGPGWWSAALEGEHHTEQYVARWDHAEIDGTFHLSEGSVRVSDSGLAYSRRGVQASGGWDCEASMHNTLPCRPARTAVPSSRLQATHVVTSPNDSGPGTLRQALLDATNGDSITFDPAVFPPASPFTIALSSGQLPDITQGALTIDASNAGVILDGSGIVTANVDGLVISSSGNIIRGLQIINFPRMGVHLVTGADSNTIGGDSTSGTGPCGQCNVIGGNKDVGVYIGSGHNNVVVGNRIGVTANGQAPLGNQGSGILLAEGSQSNYIGGTNAGEQNVISGNGIFGISLTDTGTISNVIVGNLIGTNISGTNAISNALGGIWMEGGAQWNRVGGNTTAERNLISGNGGPTGNGIGISGAGAMSNTISGNFIGTDLQGTAPLGNGYSGVYIGSGAAYNIIGGGAPGEGNLISGNAGQGIDIWGPGTDHNTVIGNFIGTNVSGTVALPNNGSWGAGILGGAQGNRIGGENASERNVLSGNDGNGVEIQGIDTMSNVVIGNYIGIDADGATALPNANWGAMVLWGARYNWIGGTDPGEGNVISGNGYDGVSLNGSGTMSNVVAGNYIGVDATGSFTIPNGSSGLWIGQASWNVIGGVAEGARNIISGNENGVWLEGNWGISHTHNIVMGNYIGTDASGTVALGNQQHGIRMQQGARYDEVRDNLISGNGAHGVYIAFSGTVSNVVSGNLVGTDASGLVPLGNAHSGIYIVDGAAHNIVGGSAAGEENVIGGNGVWGVALRGTGTTHNVVVGNSIGTGAGGGNLGNGFDGILVAGEASSNRIGGAIAGEGNAIAYNNRYGVFIIGAATLNNTLSQNSVFSNTNSGIKLLDGANAHIFSPVLTQVSEQVVKGMAVPSSTVEIFSDDGDEGRWYHGSTAANGSGYFTFTVTTPLTGTKVTATATDGDGNTSMFSSPYQPSDDVLIAAIYAPQPRQQIDVPVTPLVRVGNSGTAPATFTVTVVITQAGTRVYTDEHTIVDLGALHYQTLDFETWTPNTLGNYTFEAVAHTIVPDDNPMNNGQVLAFDVVDQRIDLWLRDNPQDDGTEPSTGSVWTSPDLWVRNVDDGLAEPQDPINNITNTVYVRVRNRGTLTATDAVVDVYWHPPSLAIGQPWWHLIDSAGISELAPGSVYTVTVDWPLEITGVLTEPYNTCLIGVISSTEDVAPLIWDVHGSNNIGQRNVKVISPVSPLLRMKQTAVTDATFNIGNPYAGEQLVDVTIDATDVATQSQVGLDIGSLLYRWQRFGQAELLGATLVTGTTQITLPGGGEAVLRGLPLAGGELVEVSLEVSNPGGQPCQIDVTEHIDGELLGGVTLQIGGVLPPLAAEFIADPLSGTAPLTVTFTDQSAGGTITEWLWDFGDGTTSTLQSPVHTYENAGTYTVTLAIGDAQGTDVTTKTNYIAVYQPAAADFTADLTEGVAPLQVQFTDLSSGDYDTHLWEFGDGITSTSGAPFHIYGSLGIYTVSLTISGPGGTDMAVKSEYITVMEEYTIYLPLVMRDNPVNRLIQVAAPGEGQMLRLSDNGSSDPERRLLGISWR